MPVLFVDVSDEDTFSNVAQQVSELLNEGQTRTALADTPATVFLNDCVNLVQEHRYDEYVSRMAQQVNLIYSKMSQKDADVCVNMLVHAVGRVPEERQASAAATLTAALVQSDERAEDRLTALLMLYGILAEQPAGQRAVLLAAAAYAARNASKCRTAFCAAVRGKAPRWVSEWGLAPAEARQLYLALAAAMRGATDRPSTREHLSLVGLALGLPAPAGVDQQGAEAAAGALADYLRSASVFTLDLLPLAPVAALASHATYGALHKLAAAVAAGDVAGTRAAATAAALESVGGGVTQDVLLSKARMTALLSACAGCGAGEVALKDLAAAMDVPEDQVPTWIVRAIGAKMLEGRLDSCRGVLSVARATHPVFAAPQWAKLASQLGALKETVAAAVEALGQVRPPPQLGARGIAAAAAAAAASRA
ncbi:hypothetical protein GPECTOR_55g257 [Gonium pectorale]|uniref:PCI domain-containing protein n=1 Tax=Gonium pectorale TaxID=33097 RepID=A0A150G693_GONPE|nr:hypothetical protein GPECTOR_55g257 [Gonium pectorale]|eukprot:KXZ45351.1 hypothetical protein GPECTOR_55g257 [Gonium pectorale]